MISPNSHGNGRPPVSPAHSPNDFSPLPSKTRGESHLPYRNRGQTRDRNDDTGRDLQSARDYTENVVLYNAIVGQLRLAAQPGVEWKDKYISLLMYRELRGQNQGDPILKIPKMTTGVRKRSKSSSSSSSSSDASNAPKNATQRRKSQVDGYIQSVTGDSHGGVSITVLCKFNIKKVPSEKIIRYTLTQLFDCSPTLSSMLKVPLKGTLIKKPDNRAERAATRRNRDDNSGRNGERKRYRSASPVLKSVPSSSSESSSSTSAPFGYSSAGPTSDTGTKSRGKRGRDENNGSSNHRRYESEPPVKTGRSSGHVPWHVSIQKKKHTMRTSGALERFALAAKKTELEFGDDGDSSAVNVRSMRVFFQVKHYNERKETSVIHEPSELVQNPVATVGLSVFDQIRLSRIVLSDAIERSNNLLSDRTRMAATMREHVKHTGDARRDAAEAMALAEPIMKKLWFSPLREIRNFKLWEEFYAIIFPSSSRIGKEIRNRALGTSSKNKVKTQHRVLCSYAKHYVELAIIDSQVGCPYTKAVWTINAVAHGSPVKGAGGKAARAAGRIGDWPTVLKRLDDRELHLKQSFIWSKINSNKPLPIAGTHASDNLDYEAKSQRGTHDTSKNYNTSKTLRSAHLEMFAAFSSDAPSVKDVNPFDRTVPITEPSNLTEAFYSFDDTAPHSVVPNGQHPTYRLQPLCFVPTTNVDAVNNLKDRFLHVPATSELMSMEWAETKESDAASVNDERPRCARCGEIFKHNAVELVEQVLLETIPTTRPTTPTITGAAISDEEVEVEVEEEEQQQEQQQHRQQQEGEEEDNEEEPLCEQCALEMDEEERVRWASDAIGPTEFDPDFSTDEENESVGGENSTVPFPKQMHNSSQCTHVLKKGRGKISRKVILRQSVVRRENEEKKEAREMAEEDWLLDATDVEPGSGDLNDDLAQKINSLDTEHLIMFALAQLNESWSALKGALEKNPQMPNKREANLEVSRLRDQIKRLELKAQNIFDIDEEFTKIEEERLRDARDIEAIDVAAVPEEQVVEELEETDEQAVIDGDAGEDGDAGGNLMEGVERIEGTDVAAAAADDDDDLTEGDIAGDVAAANTNAVPALPKRVEKDIDDENERRMRLSELLSERLLFQHSETLKMLIDAFITHPSLFGKFGSNVSTWMNDLLGRARNDTSNIVFLKRPRQNSVLGYMTEEESQSRAYVDVSGLDPHDPKTKVGMLAFLRHLSARKFGTETTAGSGALPPASQERVDAGNHVGDELTKRIILLVLKNLRRRGQHNREVRVRKLCYLLQSQLSRIFYRQGDLHFAMAAYDAAERTYQNGGQASICHVMGRGDTIRANNLSKAFQTHQKVLDEMMGGRTCAFFIEMIENGRMPMPCVLFPNDPSNKNKPTLQADIYSTVFTGSVYDVDCSYGSCPEGTMSDMHHYWGCQFGMAIGGAKEIMECTRWKDSEGMDMLVKLFYPIMIQLEKSNYYKLLENEIEQMIFDSPFRRRHWIKERFVTGESAVGHAVALDCVLENAVGELKPIQRNLSEPTMHKFSRHLFLLTTIRRMFDKSRTLGGRDRGVRAHRQAPRLQMLLKVATFFLNTGVCSENSSSRKAEWKVGNKVFHRTAHKLEKIGEAMMVEGKVVRLTPQQLTGLGYTSSESGEYKCVRAQCLPPIDGQEQVELLLEAKFT